MEKFCETTKRSELDRSCAKSRWNLLKKAVKGGLELSPCDGSIRSFSGFPVVSLEKIETGNDLNATDGLETMNGHWFRAKVSVHKEEVILEIRLFEGKIPFKKLLTEADTTGNLCLWPGEKILAYYCLQNKAIFNDKNILELGAGMTSLSGLVVASSTQPLRVILTDGNEECVSNIDLIVQKNASKLRSVEVRKLIWGQSADYADLSGQIDVILISDCLYFEKSHESLEETIWNLLKTNGLCLIFAPSRGQSFESFQRTASQRFKIEIMENYDDVVWSFHQNYLSTLKEYKTELHYPLMMKLIKTENN